MEITESGDSERSNLDARNSFSGPVVILDRRSGCVAAVVTAAEIHPKLHILRSFLYLGNNNASPGSLICKCMVNVMCLRSSFQSVEWSRYEATRVIRISHRRYHKSSSRCPPYTCSSTHPLACLNISLICRARNPCLLQADRLHLHGAH